MTDARHPEVRRGGAEHRGAAAARVLLVEGEPRLREAIADALHGAGLGVIRNPAD